MIGIIPSVSKTYEVGGFIDKDKYVEGKLYVDSDGRLYMFSSKCRRPSPDTGYFPIYDGKNKYDSSFANKKYLKDVTILDLDRISNTIDTEVANDVIIKRKRSEDLEILKPSITEEDNAFTQCVKGVILAKEVTLTDLCILANKRVPDNLIKNYYSALQRIAFMRTEKWNVWIDSILNLSYVLKVYKGNKLVVKYSHPEEKYEAGIIDYEAICQNKDPLQKIIQIVLVKLNINKNNLKAEDVDDYTINNLITAINSKKPISAQLFSRFIKIAELNYEILLYENKKMIFKYKEDHRKGRYKNEVL